MDTSLADTISSLAKEHLLTKAHFDNRIDKLEERFNHLEDKVDYRFRELEDKMTIRLGVMMFAMMSAFTAIIKLL